MSARVEALSAAVLGRLRAPWVTWALTAAFAALAVNAALGDRYLHDEGLLTYYFARWNLVGGPAALFFLKLKPALALLNLPGAALGLDAFLGWHALYTAMSVALAADVARRAELGDPWLAAWVVASSPLFFACAASGVSNADGVFVALAALRVALHGRPGWPLGLALAVIPLVRFELGMLSALLGAWALTRRPSRSFWLGLAAPVTVYVLLGSLYHRDLLWPLHFAPAYADARDKNPVVMEGIDRLRLGDILAAVAAVTPGAALTLVSTPRRRGAFAWLLFAFGAAYTLFVSITPYSRAVFGFAPRYFVVAVVPMALLAPTAVASLAGASGRAARLTVTALLLLAWVAFGARSDFAAASCAAAACVAALAAAAMPETARLALAAWLAAGLGWALARPWDATQLARVGVATDPAPVAAWLRGHPEAWRGQRVYTNLQLLGPYLRGSREIAGLDLRYIAQQDTWLEIESWTNPRVGQTEAVERLMQREFYGAAVRADAVWRGEVAPGSLVLRLPDPRLVPAAARAAWDRRTERLGRVGEVELLRVRAAE